MFSTSILSTLLSNKGFLRYFSNTSWIFAEQLIRLSSGLIVGIWVARYLGPNDLGVVSYIGAIVGIFGCFSKLGLDGILIRELVEHNQEKYTYLGTAFWLKLLGALLAIFMILIASFFLHVDTRTQFYIFIISLGLIFQPLEVIDFLFQAQAISKFISIGRFFQLVLSSLFRLGLVFFGANLFWFVIAVLLDQILIGLIFVIVYKTMGYKNCYSFFDVRVAKKLLIDSWPMIFTSFVIMIYMRIDQVMIQGMLGNEGVGIYSVALRLSEVWYFVPMIIVNSIFPALINAKSANEDLYLLRLQRLYTFLIWISISVSIVVTFLAEPAINFLYGSEFKSAAVVLTVHIWTGVFVFFGCAKGKWILTENIQKISLYCTGVGAAVNILINFILIPSMGVVGAAIATLIAQAVSALIVPLFFVKDRASVKMFFKSFIFAGLR